MVSTEKKHRFELSELLIWLGFAIIMLWIIAKIAGWISSPVWVDMIPTFGVAVTICGLGVGVGKTLHKLDVVIGDVEKLKDDVVEIKDELKTVDRRLAVLETGHKLIEEVKQ